MKDHKLYLLLFSIILFCNACNQSESSTSNEFSKCKFGTPKAIFSSQMNGIQSHKFQLENKTGIELIVFSDGKKLEVIQTGCNEIKQELTFTLLPNTNANWIEVAANELDYLSALSDDLKPFSFWAGAISSKASDFKLGQDVELEPNIFAIIDRIESSDRVLLKITLSQRS